MDRRQHMRIEKRSVKSLEQGRNTMLNSLLNKTADIVKGTISGVVIGALSITGSYATEVSYYHNDHLGTPQVITDENQVVVWDADYDPFGQATINTETVTNNVRFPGQYYDKETSLHYNYFRTYDPNLGRYITSDPIGLEGGISTYGYAYQNPLIYLDKYGLYSDPTGKYTASTVSRVVPALGPVGIGIGIGVAIGNYLEPGPQSVIDGIDTSTFPKAANDSTYENAGECRDGDDDNCSSERALILKMEIRIKNDISSGPPRFGPNAGNEIIWAAKIRNAKIKWNEWVNDYNRRCPRKIGRRFQL